MITFRLKKPGINLFQPNKILFLLWLFLLVFPKGGIKFAGIPVTWGYLLLGLVSLSSLCKNRVVCHMTRIYAFLATIPFQFVIFLSFMNGIENKGFSLSYVISFSLIPISFFIVLSEYIEKLDLVFFYRLFRRGIFLIASYGIVLFIYKYATGQFLEIPLLTINLHDLGELENKCNNRGGLFKLISSYNNGNIYGICLLIVHALFLHTETSIWRKFIVRLSLILTISRTVWAGLFFCEFFYFLLIKKSFKNIFLIILMLSSIVLFYSYYAPEFLMDRTMAGRSAQFTALENIHFFPSRPIGGSLEIIYLGILVDFGFIGLITFLLSLSAPLLVSKVIPSPSSYRKCLALGLVTYLFIGVSDGALLFIPTMAFYWFAASLLLKRKLEPEFLIQDEIKPHSMATS